MRVDGSSSSPVVDASSSAAELAPVVAAGNARESSSTAPASSLPPARAPDIHPHPMVNAFAGWAVSPTGIRALDLVLDFLFKLIISPALLLGGLIDWIAGTGLIDHTVGDIQLRTLRSGNLRPFRHASPGERHDIIARLVRTEQLLPLITSLPPEHRRELFALTLSHLDRADTAAFLIAAFMQVPELDDAITRVVHRAAAKGFLSPTIAHLRYLAPQDPRVETLSERAASLRLPLVIAHRGLPTELPENTLASVRAAMQRGADGVEIDLCMTRDGEIVLWHDADPDDAVALARQAGIEGMPFRPWVPNLGSEDRRPVHQINLTELRRTHGYQRDGDRVPGTIPTLTEFAELARQTRMKQIVLDIKLSPDSSDAQVRRFAQRLREVLTAHKLQERVILLTPHASVVRRLRAELGDSYNYSLDVEIVEAFPDPERVRGLDQGVAMGNRTVSVGRPRVGVDGYETFLEVLHREWDRPQHPNTLAWTLNDPDELTDAIGTGAVDAILTDHPQVLRRIVERLQLDNRSRPGERADPARVRGRNAVSTSTALAP